MFVVVAGWLVQQPLWGFVACGEFGAIQSLAVELRRMEVAMEWLLRGQRGRVGPGRARDRGSAQYAICNMQYALCKCNMQMQYAINTPAPPPAHPHTRTAAQRIMTT
jgi:hypothetical protein